MQISLKVKSMYAFKFYTVIANMQVIKYFHMLLHAGIFNQMYPDNIIQGRVTKSPLSQVCPVRNHMVEVKFTARVTIRG